ncbi:hypothetical protein Hanom_Chr06g00575381 [Helianthus anomalus]
MYRKSCIESTNKQFFRLVQFMNTSIFFYTLMKIYKQKFCLCLVLIFNLRLSKENG